MPPFDELTLGVHVNKCSECDKYNSAISIHDMFNWGKMNLMMRYDKSTEEILLSEEQLMRIIQIVNPAQKPRKIRLVDSVLKPQGG